MLYMAMCLYFLKDWLAITNACFLQWWQETKEYGRCGAMEQEKERKEQKGEGEMEKNASGRFG